ncbi:MAG: hypothetical protein JXB25_01390 [Deltaproteobacteria bacterium]|nr:hypothetical protein [Deltaproteobacteria bacterium]
MREEEKGKRDPRRLIREERKALKEVWQRMIREQSRIAAERKRCGRRRLPGKRPE